MTILLIIKQLNDSHGKITLKQIVATLKNPFMTQFTAEAVLPKSLL
jgi:hypothetical protein